LSHPVQNKGLLRFLTAGSVDDGKSTLIGRLLYEAGGLCDDQLESVRKASRHKDGNIDLSLVTDGLRAEREQAITIDVAYRYFSTDRRKFIIADTPGHEQYTRNMVTGATTADLAVMLIDARKGILEQTRRHAFISWLLGIRHIVVAVNKMDLVNFDAQVFADVRTRFMDLTRFLGRVETYFVPLSALAGENVVSRSSVMPWYTGQSLLEILETVTLEENDHDQEPFRFPVQNVLRPSQDFRGYAGQVVSGTAWPGQDVMVLPSGQRVRIEQVILHRQTLPKAVRPLSVVLTISDHLDLGRGDMLVGTEHLPTISKHITANLIWMSPIPLRLHVPYLVKHTTQVLCCSVVRVVSKLNIHTFENMTADTLHFNEIGKVEIEMHKAIFHDAYVANRTTGSFIIIDPSNNDTAAAGMIQPSEGTDQIDVAKAETVLGFHSSSRRQSKGLTVWVTGLSGSGKTTVCNVVFTELLARGIRVEMLDGDAFRKQFNNDLGFSKRDRDENIRRIGFVAELLSRHGVVVLVAAISPYRAVRDELRRNSESFLEVYMSAPLSVCEERDPKGLYRKARAGEILGFTGIDDPYEEPLGPELVCNTAQETVKESSEKVVAAIINFLSHAD
jgi:bifunctional enzyme CysN/CysC